MDWLQFCLAMAMAFVGLESMASGLQATPRERNWLAFWVVFWSIVTGLVLLFRMLMWLAERQREPLFYL